MTKVILHVSYNMDKRMTTYTGNIYHFFPVYTNDIFTIVFFGPCMIRHLFPAKKENKSVSFIDAINETTGDPDSVCVDSRSKA